MPVFKLTLAIYRAISTVLMLDAANDFLGVLLTSEGGLQRAASVFFAGVESLHIYLIRLCCLFWDEDDEVDIVKSYWHHSPPADVSAIYGQRPLVWIANLLDASTLPLQRGRWRLGPSECLKFFSQGTAMLCCMMPLLLPRMGAGSVGLHRFSGALPSLHSIPFDGTCS